jgi:hypothetical protein
MHQAWACRLPGTTVPWANLYRCNIYTGSTVYTTPVVLCSAVLVISSVADQATNAVPVYSLARLSTYTRSLTHKFELQVMLRRAWYALFFVFLSGISFLHEIFLKDLFFSQAPYISTSSNDFINIWC